MVKFVANLDTVVFFAKVFFTDLALGSVLFQVVVVAKHRVAFNVDILAEIEALLAGLAGQAGRVKGQIGVGIAGIKCLIFQDWSATLGAIFNHDFCFEFPSDLGEVLVNNEVSSGETLSL